MKTGILAIVVTYYPNKDLLINNINSFIDNVDKIIIWENTPLQEKEQYRFIDYPKIEYYGDSVNSISRALNFAWHYAQNNDYKFLLTMDQDSIWENFGYFIKHVNEMYNTDDTIYVPQIVPGKILVESFCKTEWAITSGMLIPISALNRLGGYNESFIIDGIDMDICFRAKEMGIDILMLKNGVLKQKYGNPTSKKMLFRKFSCSNYSPNRLQEIYSSHIYFLRFYKISIRGRYDLLKKCFAIIPIKVLFYEKNKQRKIFAIIKGIYNGFINYSAPTKSYE